MRIVIDLQGAQSNNAKRGIGRYSLAIARAVARNRRSHEVLVALNGRLTRSIESIRAAFEGVLPQDNIRVWYPPERVSSSDQDNDSRRNAAERIREAFLASLSPDIVYVTSLFEGLADDAVTSIGMFTSDVLTVVTAYDFIPYIHRCPYLDDPVTHRWYLNKLDHLRRAHLWLAISESTRGEGIEYVGLPENLVENISAGVDSRFRPVEVRPDVANHTQSKYGISRPFVMYGGGIDHRKNVEGLIRAFGLLPREVQEQHQLVIVCEVHPSTKAALNSLARKSGLRRDTMIMTGYVPDEDLLVLYNLCKLFVFPSWHEGFGLPALEAMSCDAPVIAANTASLPEVVGRKDALFDPHCEEAIAAKVNEALGDESFLQELSSHGREQALRFSWDRSALRAIAAFEKLHEERQSLPVAPFKSNRRPKLAYISPLPPERSGVADYSAELLPELARHYDIEVIVAQEEITDTHIRACHPIRSVEWFVKHASRFDRRLYQFGNSEYHTHMFSLLERIPGFVVLNDFFLSGIQAYMETHGESPGTWVRELYRSHGYSAVRERYHVSDVADVVFKYPCNFNVLRRAVGIALHSRHAARLAEDWYGEDNTQCLSIIPLLRVPARQLDPVLARQKLGLKREDFLVCSFGLLGPTKLNKRLLDAWLASSLAQDPNCRLVFVGQNDPNQYGRQLQDTIRHSGSGDRITITGWTDAEVFRIYLEASDIGVQLRTYSRGEASAAVLDCMNYRTPVIVNAIGSMQELPSDTVFRLPGDFQDEGLSHMLEELRHNGYRRESVADRAQSFIQSHHDPRLCADQYREAIERAYSTAQQGRAGLVESVAVLEYPADREKTWADVADAVAKTLPEPRPARQLFIDVSEIVQQDAGSGIQRVTRRILREFLLDPPSGYRVEPVYATMKREGYKYARKFALALLECEPEVLDDAPIEAHQDDVFIGLDLQPHVVPSQLDYLLSMRHRGVHIYFVVYDLLAIHRPDVFVDGAKELYVKWLNCVGRFDGAICISKTVAAELSDWMEEEGPERLTPFKIGWFHLGADVPHSAGSPGSSKERHAALEALETRQSFLMVGTIEPRKGYVQALAAFDELWRKGVDINLVIVGRHGWLMDSFIKTLRNHSENGKRLLWLDGIDDDYLEEVYANSTCLLAASEGEGFGLPLIEAARHGVPIIARDIPVFREVAGEHAYYFDGETTVALASALQDWLRLYEGVQHPRSDDLPWLSWHQSADRIKNIVFKDHWYGNVNRVGQDMDLGFYPEVGEDL